MQKSDGWAVGDKAKVISGRLKDSTGTVRGLGRGWVYFEPTKQPDEATKGTQWCIADTALERVN